MTSMFNKATSLIRPCCVSHLVGCIRWVFL